MNTTTTTVEALTYLRRTALSNLQLAAISKDWDLMEKMGAELEAIDFEIRRNSN